MNGFLKEFMSSEFRVICHILVHMLLPMNLNYGEEWVYFEIRLVVRKER